MFKYYGRDDYEDDDYEDYDDMDLIDDMIEKGMSDEAILFELMEAQQGC